MVNEPSEFMKQINGAWETKRNSQPNIREKDRQIDRKSIIHLDKAIDKPSPKGCGSPEEGLCFPGEIERDSHQRDH